ncbi:hypothetical protein CEP53_010991 [Fusarium sp. AF-6]|nr:hypothetical protein CEP53_010991 [Fusarium sp. AF-6]
MFQVWKQGKQHFEKLSDHVATFLPTYIRSDGIIHISEEEFLHVYRQIFPRSLRPSVPNIQEGKAQGFSSLFANVPDVIDSWLHRVVRIHAQTFDHSSKVWSPNYGL